ncbi:hypothetical protein TNCV_4208671 [Trichonephila clavipes]|nr:hypothetical protein TNCV_4208671 [Trichonephila clavipes]
MNVLNVMSNGIEVDEECCLDGFEWRCRKRLYLEIVVPASTQADYSELVPTSTHSGIFVDGSSSTQAEYLSMVPTSTTGGTKFPKNGGAVSSTDGFFHCPNFDQNRNFFDPGSTHVRSIHAEFKPLQRLNEVSNGGASSSRTLYVHCPDFVCQNRNFCRSWLSLNLWGDNKGVQDHEKFRLCRGRVEKKKFDFDQSLEREQKAVRRRRRAIFRNFVQPVHLSVPFFYVSDSPLVSIGLPLRTAYGQNGRCSMRVQAIFAQAVD